MIDNDKSADALPEKSHPWWLKRFEHKRGLSVFLEAQEIEAACVEIERLRAAMEEAVDALAGGLWDYGSGQDEHDRCNEVVARCRAVLAGEKS